MLNELSTKGGFFAPNSTGFGRMESMQSILGKRVMRGDEEP